MARQIIEREQNLDYLNKSTLRVLKILDFVVANSDRSVGVTEVSKALEISKNLAFRALQTLMEEGFVNRNPESKRYHLGTAGFEFPATVPDALDLKNICMQYMREIHDLTGETVTLSVLDGNYTIVVEGIEGRNPIVTRVMYGKPIPLHAGPGSRAVLAFMSDHRIDQYIAHNSPLQSITPTTITEPELLRKEVQRIRRAGYALGFRDNMPTGNAVAFPVLDSSKQSLGAIAIGGQAEQFPMDKLMALLEPMGKIMDRLNAETRVLNAHYPASDRSFIR